MSKNTNELKTGGASGITSIRRRVPYGTRLAYERAEDRRGYRNGAETRRVTTSVGTRELRVPRARVRDEETGVLALFTVGDVYTSLCKKGAYAPFSAQRRSRALF